MDGALWYDLRGRSAFTCSGLMRPPNASIRGSHILVSSWDNTKLASSRLFWLPKIYQSHHFTLNTDYSLVHHKILSWPGQSHSRLYPRIRKQSCRHSTKRRQRLRPRQQVWRRPYPCPPSGRDQLPSFLIRRRKSSPAIRPHRHSRQQWRLC